MHIARRSVFALVALAFVAASAASAGPVNRDGRGLALDGYDPVAYFTEQRAVRGNEAIVHTHEGTTYRFASTANRDAFVKAIPRATCRNTAASAPMR